MSSSSGSGVDSEMVATLLSSWDEGAVASLHEEVVGVVDRLRRAGDSDSAASISARMLLIMLKRREAMRSEKHNSSSLCSISS